ncbi:MAG TPA: Wzz/FepE/Etk N-terminal domain-containing protein, partial [Gemmatimonadaceae bacterium]
MNSQADTIDLADIGRAFRRGWRAVIAFLLLGTVAAIGVILWAPRQFEGSTTLVVRESSASGSLLSRLGLPGDMGNLLSAGGGSKSSQETELQILNSRSIIAKVIDSLGLQLRVSAPPSQPVDAIIASTALGRSFKTRKYKFSHSADGKSYTVAGNDESATATPGTPVKLAVGTLTLRADTTLPPQFALVVMDHEDAIKYAQKHAHAEKAAGDVIRVRYDAGDSLTAARAANALATVYLAQRKTNDRGSNAHRVEFLTERSDSISGELAVAEDELRRVQEQNSMFDPMIVGKAEIERASDMRGQLTELQVEGGAVDALLGQVQQGAISERSLAAFPTFIKSPAISQMIAQLSLLEADRQKLLGTRTEQDPEVIALEASIKAVDAQLLPIAKSYSSSILKEKSDLEKALDTLHTMALTLPKSAESVLRKQRDVVRLSQIFAAVQAQLVSARLAAIDEGGDARQLDAAEPSKKPVFPEPVTTLGLGVGGGLVAGLIAALMLSGLGRWARDPYEVERIAGVPSLRFDATAPLLLSGAKQARTLLVLPLDAGTSSAAVARRLADTAMARSISATVLDLSGRRVPSTNGRTPAAIAPPSDHFDVNGAIERLEREYGLVIVQLPELASDVA